MPAAGHRLPRVVEPQHYQLTFTLRLDEGTFSGEERVTVTVHEPTAEVVLNAVDLEILTAELTDEAGTVRAGAVRARPDHEQVAIGLDGRAAPGRHTLHLTFRGALSDQLRGIYRSVHTDDEGVEHVLAATQFEPTDARRAFPCWDEPDFKATFATTLVIDAGLTAVSNTELAEVSDLGDGKQQVEFAPTMKMSTYLVAFVVGPLELTEPTDVDGVALRVACVPGKAHLAGFALEVGAHALGYFSRYFGVPYPAAKLDLIALPDFAMGAMENLGAVTFRETLLLIDPGRATRAELERVADVVAHELAHMWFGDLVTMRWWNGIWLNEAFATFMELLCVDDFRPGWKRWVSFGGSRDEAMVVDALAATRPVEFPVERPEDAEGMFDVLTYQKGAAVLRMLERYTGAEPFRTSIASYIARHAYANTETADLWDALEEVTGVPARSMMESWIHQGGFPVVTASLDGDGAGLALAQGRFRYGPAGAAGAGADADADADGGPAWRVPVLLRASVGGAVAHHRVLLDGEGARLDLGGPVEWVVVNEGGWGFYRVRYDAELRRRLTADLGRLDALERLGLVSDTWASALAGTSPVSDVVDLALLLGGEDDPAVFDALFEALDAIDRAVPPEDRPAVQAFVRHVGGPALERVGWAPAPGEDDRRARLRAGLVRALGVLGADPSVRDTAAELHAAALADPAAVDADVAGAVVAVVAAAGGPAEYEAFLARYRAPATPQEELRYLYALARFEDAELVRRTFELARGDQVRTQNAPFLLSALLANRAGGELAWAGLKRHWDELTSRVPAVLHDRMLEGVVALSTPAVAADVHDFLEAHPVPARQRTVDQLLERLDVAVAFRRREGAVLAAALEQALAAARARRET